MSTQELIPGARRDAVRDAFKAAFGTDIAHDLQPLRGGVSGALICRCSVQGRRYVLRVEPERTALHDRERGYACMTAAAAVGAAPRLHYGDPGAGVAIMDFVAGRPLATHPGGPTGAAQALGELIARIQATPPFPAPSPGAGDYPDVLVDMLAGLRESGLVAAEEVEPLAQGLARIRAALPWNASLMVSTHNDPNPRNILFDGQRVWLVDWELAFLNDPLVDVAILTTDLVEAPDLQEVLLRAALGAVPDRAVHARLGVIRLLTRLFYGCVVLDGLGPAARSIAALGLPTFTPAGFRRAVAEGQLGSGTPEAAYAFARMSLAAFRQEVATPGVSEALRIVAQG